jgi:hypothetical protein
MIILMKQRVGLRLLPLMPLQLSPALVTVGREMTGRATMALVVRLVETADHAVRVVKTALRPAAR